MTAYADASLFDLVDEIDEGQDLLTVERVIVDERRGHLLLHGEPEHVGGGKPAKSRDVAFADLGTRLHLWSGQGCSLGPRQARDLAAALTWWADRQAALPP